MGENDEKVTSVPTPAADETEKLLTPENKKTETPNKSDKSDKSNSNETNKDDITKVNGVEIVNIPENDSKDEPKPKKNLIGGIKLPGLFTLNRKKDAGDGADGELLDNAANEPIDKGITKEKAENPPRSFLSTIKFTNLFAKKTAEAKPDEPKENKEGTYYQGFFFQMPIQQ